MLVAGLAGGVSAGPKILAGVDQGDKIKLSLGMAIQITPLIWSITSFDMNLAEGEKKLQPMLAALFRLPLPVRLKVGPILGPEFEYTDEGTLTGDALTYIKGGVGFVASLAFNEAATTGIIGYYKASISFDDATTTPLGPSFGGRFFLDISLLSGGN